MIRCSCGAELFFIESICSVCIPSKPPRALFVEDLRIKLANRELEILDWKEAAEIANAENDDLRREVAATTKHAQLLNKMLGEADARAERLRVALEFYADENNWRDQPFLRMDHLGRECEDLGPAEIWGDNGGRARKALEDDKQ